MTIYKSDLAFGVAGWAWVAIRGDEVVDLIPMAMHSCFFGCDPQVILEAGKKRVCASSRRLAEKKTHEAFLLHREKSVFLLRQKGTVFSAMVSCGDVIIY